MRTPYQILGVALHSGARRLFLWVNDNGICILVRLPWVHYRYRQTTYHIGVTQIAGGNGGAAQLTLDDAALPGVTVALRDDGKEHRIEFEFHTPVKAPSNLPARARSDFQAAR